MKEIESNNSWFPNWEHQLPSPEDLMPITQTLITPDLAIAFDIPVNHNSGDQNHNSFDFDSSDLNSMPGGPADEPARTLKRPRLVWTPQLHKRFVDAVAHLGIKNAVPKTIMQLMSVDGLTRENVASHLQKYRLYLKRMQGIGGNGGVSGPISAADAATDRLFASTAVPPHFLRPGAVSGPAGGPEPYVPYVPVVSAMQHQQYYEHQRNLGHFGGGGGFDHGFLNRAIAQPGMHRMVGTGMGLISPSQTVNSAAGSYIDELEAARRGGGDDGARKVLTLFPTADD